MQPIHIEDHEISDTSPVFIIAEGGINHNGSLETAFALIESAAIAGCDAIKFQKRSIRAMLSRDAYNKPYNNNGNSYGQTYGEHRERMELSPAQWLELRTHSKRHGIMLLGSAWDRTSALFLNELGIPVHKIGSPDLTDLPLCSLVAQLGKPVILSCGMSRLAEVDIAVETILKANPRLILLQCVSAYPAPYPSLNLRCIQTLRERYDIFTGYSGHEDGWHAVIAAVALGARVIEKHITLDRSMKGGDHCFSLEPQQLHRMVREIREVESALERTDKRLLPAELPFRRKLAKSVTSRGHIRRGTTITADMLTCKSPATGVSPLQLDDLVGKTAAQDIEADCVIHDEDIYQSIAEGSAE